MKGDTFMFCRRMGAGKGLLAGLMIGAAVGVALAVVLSYTKWQSIGWAIFHGLLNWVYVIYYVIRY